METAVGSRGAGSPVVKLDVSRLFIPAVLACLAISAYILGITEYLTFVKLKEHRAALQLWVATHPTLAPVAYVALFV